MTYSLPKRFICLLYVVAFLFPAFDSIAQEANSTDLARRYVSLRPSVLSVPAGTSPIKPEDIRRALSVASAGVLQQFGRGSDWNPNHPEWKRLAAIIENDIEQATQQMAKDPWIAEISKKTEEVFVRGISSRLSPAELNTLVRFYSSSAGTKLARIQQQMFDEVAPTIANRQLQMMSGQKPRATESLKDSEEVKQIVGLLDEWVRIQWALFDPGPKGDRSGLQAIPFLVIIAVETHYARYSALWREISEQDRRAILNWRESAAGKKERDAIFETAKELKTELNIDLQTRRIFGMLTAYEQKWRTLIQSSK